MGTVAGEWVGRGGLAGSLGVQSMKEQFWRREGTVDHLGYAGSIDEVNERETCCTPWWFPASGTLLEEVSRKRV